jgi:hypothetical protein
VDFVEVGLEIWEHQRLQKVRVKFFKETIPQVGVYDKPLKKPSWFGSL